MKILIKFILLIFLLSGCATKMYYWGGYSNTLYNYKKNPTDENLKEHKEELEDIIRESKSKGLRVPPGIWCEYGYMLLKEGYKDRALKCFAHEAKLYPEARVFIKRLKDNIKK